MISTPTTRTYARIAPDQSTGPVVSAGVYAGRYKVPIITDGGAAPQWWTIVLSPLLLPYDGYEDNPLPPVPGVELPRDVGAWTWVEVDCGERQPLVADWPIGGARFSVWGATVRVRAWIRADIIRDAPQEFLSGPYLGVGLDRGEMRSPPTRLYVSGRGSSTSEGAVVRVPPRAARYRITDDGTSLAPLRANQVVSLDMRGVESSDIVSYDGQVGGWVELQQTASTISLQQAGGGVVLYTYQFEVLP